MLEHHRPDVSLERLRAIAEPQRGKPTPLSASSPPRGPLDRTWGLRVNIDVEPDL
jgi:hypothetical protein